MTSLKISQLNNIRSWSLPNWAIDLHIKKFGEKEEDKYRERANYTSCTRAATLKASFWRRSPSSSNKRAVRHPHPLGPAFGKRVPVCFKLPNTVTSLFDGQLNYKPKHKTKIHDYIIIYETHVQWAKIVCLEWLPTWLRVVTFSQESTNIWTWRHEFKHINWHIMKH